jgi:hypothetical protein
LGGPSPPRGARARTYGSRSIPRRIPPSNLVRLCPLPYRQIASVGFRLPSLLHWTVSWFFRFLFYFLAWRLRAHRLSLVISGFRLPFRFPFISSSSCAQAVLGCFPCYIEAALRGSMSLVLFSRRVVHMSNLQHFVFTQFAINHI